ncbi:MAG: DUF2157 domain-containing protein, partial [Chitinophagaceae bacterium]
ASVAWRESASSFLFFAVGASISLISQVYNIPGNLASFIFTWMLLCLPVIYIMQSSVVSILYLIGITFYATETNYWTYQSSGSYYYWLLLLLTLPHYYFLNKNQRLSSFTALHNWLIPLSLTICLGTIAQRHGELMFVGYMSMFGLFCILANSAIFKAQNPTREGYSALESLGTISLLLALSFTWFWSELRSQNFTWSEVLKSPEFIVTMIISLLALYFIFIQKRVRSLHHVTPTEPVFLIFIFIFMIGLVSPIAVILINLLVLAIGVLTIRNATRTHNLGTLNYGLLIIASLVVCRFFDTDLSFVLRGILFLVVGIGFFTANSYMIKKRKVNV